MINNRQEDLSKIFDRTWNANHNDVAKKGREREKEFMNKMFGLNKSSRALDNTPSGQVQRLQNNINNSFNGQRQVKLNNIVKKWK